MNRQQFQAQGWLWAAAGAIALLLLVGVSYYNWQKIQRAHTEVRQAEHTVSALWQLFSTLQDAETGQRGYLLTGAERYLEPNRRALTQVDPLLQSLLAHETTPVRRILLERLSVLSHTKIAELQETIDHRAAGDASGALAIVKTDRGKQAMDEIRDVMSQLQQQQEAVLSQRQAEIEHQARSAFWVTGSSALLLLLLLSIGNVTLARQRARADAASLAKSQFLSNMSHELRTPLNAIIGYSEMLEEEAQDTGGQEMLGDLGKIRSAGKHLLSLINSVLDLSKIEAGKMELFLEIVSIPLLIKEVVDVVQPLMAQNGNQFTMELSPDVGHIRADQTKLRQSLFNLLSNAAKFTEQGQVSLTVHREQSATTNELVFIVKDTGVGLTVDQQARLFQAFTQADASTSRRFGGTGLGLALSRRFAQLMGGEIEVQSVLGQGSSFTLRLPAGQTTLPASARPSSSPSLLPHTEGTQTPRDVVLVIDDDPIIADLLTRALEKYKFQVVAAHSGEEGIRLARKLSPLAITLDVMMPGMDGWTVLSKLKHDAELSHIPVIMLTIVDAENRGYLLGAAEYLHKPIDRNRLLPVLLRYRSHSAGLALVVDDDPAARELVRRTLESDGWKVVEADNGRTALERVASQIPSVILLDLMMPEMDGFEFVEQLRTRPEGRSIPIIAITAKDLNADERAQLSGQVTDILQKGSYDRDQLLEEVSALVAQCASGNIHG